MAEKKTAVFIIVQDEKKTLHPLATIFIKQCYETLIDVAQECGGKLPFRTNFILDEFANMPPLKDVTTMVTAARSRHIRFTFIIQNFAQLTQVYGKENGDTIRGNCNLVYLISSEIAALEEISKMCGEVKSKEKEKTASTPLVTVSDLQRLNKFEIIILRRRMYPYKTRFQTDFEVDWGRTYPKSEPSMRQKKPVELFDIREFVKEKKKEKMEKMPEFQNGITSPFMGNPFMNNPFMNGSPLGGNLAPNYMNPMASPFKDDGKLDDNSSGTFNIDELVKKIDAKIAEIEEEEKIKENDNKINTNISDLVPNKEAIAKETVENKDAESKALSESQNQNSLYEDNTDDDAFFDDFFSDD